MPCPIYGRDFSRLRELHAGPGCWSVTLERRYLRVAADTKPRKSLRFRRLMLGMSQTDIADALGVTFQQVQKYEKGANRVSASRLQHLSQILQVTVPFFFEGAPAVSGIPQAAKGRRRTLPLPPT
jgi:DNA-binding XRE family transcriptional regulator